MKTIISLTIVLLLPHCCAAAPDTEDTDGIPYGVASWSEGQGGNHRAVVEVADAVPAVRVRLPWRSHSPILDSDAARMLVYDAHGRGVSNIACGPLSREAGEIAFEPIAGPGQYFVYFMFRGNVEKLRGTVDAAWLAANGLQSDSTRFSTRVAKLPEAKLLRFESKSDFDRRDPMELIATQPETTGLLEKHPQDYLVFPEDRRFPTRMFSDLPYRWIRRGPGNQFVGEAGPNEYFTFQLGIYAARQKLSDIKLEIRDLQGPGGAVLPAKSIHCINAGGLDSAGKPFTKSTVVDRGTVKALWFVVDIPHDIAPGKYEGQVNLKPVGENRELAATPMTLTITVGGEPVAERGCLDAWRMSRLAWLDSTKGLEDEVVPPFTPVEWQDDTAKLLNRSIRFNAFGFPQEITAGTHPLLAGAIEFTVEDGGGPLALTAGRQVITEVKKSRVSSSWEHRSDRLQMNVQATVEFDGCIDYRIKLRAEQAFDSRNIGLDIPLRSEIAEYFMGLGQRGGIAPQQVNWKWDVDRVTNKLWTGNAQGGLILDLKHNQDVWPIAFNYRTWGKPAGWDNRGKGGCDFTRDRQVTRVRAYTGPRFWKAGDEEEFHFRMLVTPFKPIDMTQYGYRYSGKEPRHAHESSAGPKNGCTIAHTHHAMDRVNPWINYPFLTIDGMKSYREQLIKDGYQDMDLYYTLREISNHMPEIWPLRSLDDEIYSSNESMTYDEHGGRVFKGGGGYSWLQEHLRTGYAPAWTTGAENSVDAAIATQGVSRLHNFYAEGMDVLMKRVGFKGLYLDGIGYDRKTMQRIARVMARNAADYRIKLHSGNNYDYGGWHCNAMLHYGEHLPYVTDLYIGEGYNYNAAPDYWFVEMSGIPFGLTNEMLGWHNNPWRGMVYGMDSRESGVAASLWKFWDAFGIEKSQMIGYWDPQCPVKTDKKGILATVFRNGRKTLVAVASWNPQPQMCRLTINWDALDLDPQKAKLFAPAVDGFQAAAAASASAELPVMPGRGYLLLLDQETHDAPPFVIDNAYEGRQVLLSDSFDRAELGGSWKVSVSEKPPTTLKLAENAIVLESPANCYAYAERALPPGVGILECQLDSGSDRGATWGTGCSLVWPDRTLRLNLRADRHFGIDDGKGQALSGEVEPNTVYSVRFRLEKDQLLIETSTNQKLWWTLQSLPRGNFPGDPVAVRLGKMNAASAAANSSPPGPVGTSRIKELRVYGMQRKGE